MTADFKADLYRYYGPHNKSGIKLLFNILFRQNLLYMYLFRKNKKRKRAIYELLLYILRKKYGLEISSSATIGKGFYIGHPFCITIGGDVKIGNNVNVSKGVTIGVAPPPTHKNAVDAIWGSPQIGNCVMICVNATIVGDITIGDDVVIGPGALVNRDVPSHSVVIGNPGVVHAKSDVTYNYILNRV